MQKDGWARYIPNLAFKQCYLTPNFNHLITKNNAQFLTAPTLFFFCFRRSAKLFSPTENFCQRPSIALYQICMYVLPTQDAITGKK